MKNKVAAQVRAKKKHLEQLKTKRRLQPVLERDIPTKIEKPTILIVCEGKNTEPSYFSQFRLSSATIKSVGNGNNTISLVNEAIEISKKTKYEKVWCVFDKDQFAANDFNKAISVAEGKNFGVAYSNQAFEYWLILHFEDHQGGGMSRTEYSKTINEYIKPLGATYDGNGNKNITEEFFEILNGIDTKTKKLRIKLAITRAKRNYNLFNHLSPASEESSTTVFKLIEKILKYI